MQSPKSQRSKAPGESPSSDNNPEVVKGGTNPQVHGSGPSSPSVPSGLDKGKAGHQGNTEAESAVPVGSTTPHQGGGPGYAKGKGDAERSGGTVHQT